MTNPAILLLQARRSSDPSKAEERRSFAVRCGLPNESFTSHDLLEGAPTRSQIERFDAVMIGGSGDFYVSKQDLEHDEAILDFLAEAAHDGPPIFASCFGYQLLVQSLGGEILHDPASTEVGTYEIGLTAEGVDDELFGSLPRTFLAQLGRKDRAVALPEGVPNLARSELCPFQGLRVPGRPVWGSQFHPELDGETNRQRYLFYLEGYSDHMSEEERRAALGRFGPSPDTLGLLSRFVDLVFG